MRQASFAQFTCVSIDVSNLLEARMIITSYNQHVRLLSSEPFGWFAPPKFTRAWEPTLFMESLHSRQPVAGSILISTVVKYNRGVMHEIQTVLLFVMLCISLPSTGQQAAEKG